MRLGHRTLCGGLQTCATQLPNNISSFRERSIESGATGHVCETPRAPLRLEARTVDVQCPVAPQSNLLLWFAHF